MADWVSRRFLEPPLSGVDSYVKVSIDWDEGGTWQSVLLKIADCDRRVELWFNKSNGKRRNLAKLAKLQAALDEVREELETW